MNLLTGLGLSRNVGDPHTLPDVLPVSQISPNRYKNQRHIIHVFASFCIGGVPIRICDIINRLGPEFRHTIVSLDGCYDAKNRLHDDACVELAEVEVGRRTLMQTVFAAGCELRALKPDVVATYNWGAIEWAFTNTWLVRGRHIHFESGFGPEEADHQIRRRVLFRRIALSGRAHVVVPSRTLYQIATRVWKLRPNKVLYVPNGVDYEYYGQFSKSEVAPGSMSKGDDIVVGTVAPLRTEKNIARLLQAFAQIPDIDRPTKLIIAGDGGERGQLETLAKKLGIADRTTFYGHVENVAEILGMIDVFCISSDTEQMPNSLLQAMAAGCAIASVDVGDIGGMVAPENYAYIVPRDVPNALSDALTTLLKNDDLRYQIARANLQHVQEKYAFSRMVVAYRTLFSGQEMYIDS